MTISTIAELAQQAGAELQPPLPKTELIGFRLRPDGGLTVMLASGETLRAAGHDELPPEWRERNKRMIASLRRVVPGGRIETGVNYLRRQTELAEGVFGISYTEAGR